MKKSDLVEHLYQFQKRFHGERMTPEFERKLMEEILDECLKMGMLPPYHDVPKELVDMYGQFEDYYYWEPEDD